MINHSLLSNSRCKYSIKIFATTEEYTTHSIMDNTEEDATTKKFNRNTKVIESTIITYRKQCCIMTIKPIRGGDEIYVTYGRSLSLVVVTIEWCNVCFKHLYRTLELIIYKMIV